MAIRKKYYNLEEAAENLQISKRDLIHSAAIGRINFYVYCDYSYVNFFCRNIVNGYKGFYGIHKDDIRDSELIHKSSEKIIHTKGLVFRDTDELYLYVDNRDVESKPIVGYNISDILIFNDDLLRFSKQKEVFSTGYEEGSTPAPEENPKTINSLLTMIITMAIKGYSYAPDEKRSQTAKEIASDADQLGLSISDDTIRKWLKKAAGLLD
jgi:hypothetical protein